MQNGKVRPKVSTVNLRKTYKTPLAKSETTPVLESFVSVLPNGELDPNSQKKRVWEEYSATSPYVKDIRGEHGKKLAREKEAKRARAPEFSAQKRLQHLVYDMTAYSPKPNKRISEKFQNPKVDYVMKTRSSKKKLPPRRKLASKVRHFFQKDYDNSSADIYESWSNDLEKENLLSAEAKSKDNNDELSPRSRAQKEFESLERWIPEYAKSVEKEGAGPAYYGIKRHPAPSRFPSKVQEKASKCFKSIPKPNFYAKQANQSSRTNKKAKTGGSLGSTFSYMLENINIPNENAHRLEISKEMKSNLKKLLKRNLNGGYWENEVTSYLARPLGAVSYCSYEAQMAQPGTAAKLCQDEITCIDPEPMDTKWNRLKPGGETTKLELDYIEKQQNPKRKKSTVKTDEEKRQDQLKKLKSFFAAEEARTISPFPYSSEAHQAATIIESLWRKWERKRYACAAKIQSVMRVCLSKSFVERKVIVMVEACLIVQSLVRGHLGRIVYSSLKEAIELGTPIGELNIHGILCSPTKVRCELARYQRDKARWRELERLRIAATRIQSSFRGMLGRRKFEQAKIRRAIEVKNAQTMQRIFRGHRGRKETRAIKATFYPGLRAIQAKYRAMLVKRNFLKFLAYRERQALNIQRCFRGMKGRSVARYHKSLFDGSTALTKLARGIYGRRKAEQKRKQRTTAELGRLKREETCLKKAMDEKEVEVRKNLKSKQDWKLKLKDEIKRAKSRKKRLAEKRKKMNKEEIKLSIAEEAFDFFDLDGSKDIDKNEFIKVMKELCCPLEDKQVDDAIASMDKDGSGVVEFSEFVGWYNSDDNEKASSVGAQLMKVKLIAAKKVRDLSGLTIKYEATNVIVRRERQKIAEIVRMQFRRKEPADHWYHEFGILQTQQ